MAMHANTAKASNLWAMKFVVCKSKWKHSLSLRGHPEYPYSVTHQWNKIHRVTFDLPFPVTINVTQKHVALFGYVSTANEPAAYPKHPRICAGLWSTRRPHSTSLSSGCLYENPCRNRSSQSPGCSRGCLSERVRRWQLWQPICRTTARTTSPGPTTQTNRASSRASLASTWAHNADNSRHAQTMPPADIL